MGADSSKMLADASSGNHRSSFMAPPPQQATPLSVLPRIVSGPATADQRQALGSGFVELLQFFSIFRECVGMQNGFDFSSQQSLATRHCLSCYFRRAKFC